MIFTMDGDGQNDPADIPKLVALFATMVVAGPWMITMLTDYMRRLFSSIPGLVG